MEPLWSPVVATGGKRSQIGWPQKPQKQAKTVAVGCDRLPNGAHGKEGGRRFESVRGLHEDAANRHLRQRGRCLRWRQRSHRVARADVFALIPSLARRGASER